MSDFPNNLDPGRNLPSSYQEILRHRRLIDEELIPFMQFIQNAFGDGFKPGNGDVIFDENGVPTVPGITIVVNNTYIQKSPDDYDRDLTFEVTDRDSVDLPTTEGNAGSNVTIMTVHVHQTIVNEDGTVTDAYPAWQIAYGDENGHLYLYYRTSDPLTNEWNPWTKVFDLEVMLKLNPDVIEEFSHRQILENDVLPVGQKVGDYWLWPIQKGVDPVLDGAGIEGIEDIDWPPDMPAGYMFRSLEGDYADYKVPADDCRYFFFDLEKEQPLIPKYDQGERDEMQDIENPRNDLNRTEYEGYFAVDSENPNWKWYYCDHLNPDNEDAIRSQWKLIVLSGGGLPVDPDGQKNGDNVPQDVVNDIIIVDVDTGRELERVCGNNGTRNWFMEDIANSANRVELVGTEFRRYATLDSEDKEGDLSNRNTGLETP